jgi:hypothetical protein
LEKLEKSEIDIDYSWEVCEIVKNTIFYWKKKPCLDKTSLIRTRLGGGLVRKSCAGLVRIFS